MAFLHPVVKFPPITWGKPFDGITWRDERCIEIPLGIEALAAGTPGLVLDAGCAMNGVMEGTVAHVTHFTQSLAEEKIYDSPLRTYTTGDLRDLSRYRDRHFDRIVCISTLEQVGGDNTVYGGAAEARPETVRDAVSELWRICGESLLITVPFRMTAASNGRWRYFTPETYASDILSQIHQADTFYMETAYYRRKIYPMVKDGVWVGPFLEPMMISPGQEGPDAAKVQQIACLLVKRC